MTDAKPFVIKSWAPEQLVEGKWSRNGLRFRHEADAELSAKLTFTKWKQSLGFRAAPTADKPTAIWVDGEMSLLPEDES